MMGKKFLPSFIVIIIIAGTWFFKNMTQYYKGPISDHYDGIRFFNPGSSSPFPPHGFLDLLKWRMSGVRGKWPEHIKNALEDHPPAKVMGGDLRVSWVGHVTFLIQTQGINILTDPVWADRASPFSWAGPQRVCEPGIQFDKLPKIDLVLVSHNHYDHLDLPTLKRLWDRDQPVIITPLGNDTIIKDYDPRIQVKTNDWEQKITFNQDIEVDTLPSHHWSARGIWDRNKALWASFLIKTPHGNIYFVGDSGYGEGKNFKNLSAQHQKIRLALLPMGAFKPRWFMEYAHMEPRETVLAFKDLNADYGVPSHYNTFPLGDDSYNEALTEFHHQCKHQKVNEKHFKALQIGEHWFVPKNA